MQGLSKTYPAGKKVLDNIHLSFYPDAKIGVLGVNGSGKSTLLRIMAGIDTDYVGEGWVAEGARVGYLEQEPQLDASQVGARERDGGRRRQEGAARPLQRIRDELLRRDRRRDGEAAGRDRLPRISGTSTARSTWRWTRCAARPTTPTSPSSPAARSRRVALCRLLLDAPDLLLLDEPTNHLDAESVNWLEGHLRNYPGAILIVTHDRYFLDNVTGWILELDHGRGIPYEGNYTSWLAQKQKRMEQEGREDEARRRTLERESEWISLVAQGAAGEIEGALSSATRSCSRSPTPRPTRWRRSPFRSPSGSARTWSTSTT